MGVTVSPVHRDSRTAGQATSGTVRRGRAEDGADADCARDGLPAFRHRPPDGETPGRAQDSINDYRRSGDWHEGNHPGYALGCWLREYKEQVFLFTRDFAVDWTTNVAERGAKAAKRHQAVSGYWHEWRYRHSCQYADAVVMPRLVWQTVGACAA